MIFKHLHFPNLSKSTFLCRKEVFARQEKNHSVHIKPTNSCLDAQFEVVYNKPHQHPVIYAHKICARIRHFLSFSSFSGHIIDFPIFLGLLWRWNDPGWYTYIGQYCTKLSIKLVCNVSVHNSWGLLHLPGCLAYYCTAFTTCLLVRKRCSSSAHQGTL